MVRNIIRVYHIHKQVIPGTIQLLYVLQYVPSVPAYGSTCSVLILLIVASTASYMSDAYVDSFIKAGMRVRAKTSAHVGCSRQNGESYERRPRTSTAKPDKVLNHPPSFLSVCM